MNHLPVLDITQSQTTQLAQALCKHLRTGDVVGLIGNLGAGKTTLVKKLAKLWGVRETVTSPTFSLVQIYHAKIRGNSARIYHIDMYRIDSEEEAQSLGLQEMFDEKNAIILIEWADKFPNLLPDRTIMVKLHH